MLDMGDAGEGLVDAEDRYQQKLAEREQQKQARKGPRADAAQESAKESLRLARAELVRQQESTSHPVRREQIQRALEDLDRRLAE